MGDVVSALPEQLQGDGKDIRIFMPRFGVIKERKHRLHEVIRLSGINVPVGDDDNPLLIKVASLPTAKKQIYFLDNEYYFNKRGVFTDSSGKLMEDNDDRIVFFNKGVMEILHKLEWVPDIIHCHGWMCGLAAMYARTQPRNELFFKNSKFIYSVYDKEDVGPFGTELKEKAAPNEADMQKEHYKYLDNPTSNDLYMTGIAFADAIIKAGSNLDPDVENCLNLLNVPVLQYDNPASEEALRQTLNFYEEVLGVEVQAKE